MCTQHQKLSSPQHYVRDVIIKYDFFHKNNSWVIFFSLLLNSRINNNLVLSLHFRITNISYVLFEFLLPIKHFIIALKEHIVYIFICLIHVR